jgi:mRNA interferase RelE/StbE
LAWSVEFQEQALEDLRRLDKPAQRQILRYLHECIEGEEAPRRFGKALTGNRVGLWRYRIGDYRVICSIEDDRLVVLVVHAGHRKSVYKS